MNSVFTIECANLEAIPDPRQIMYVEKEYDWYMNQFVSSHVQKFESAFAYANYEFCYLPNVEEKLGMAMCMSQLVNSCVDFKPSLCKFSHMDDNRAVFYCMELDMRIGQSLVMQFYSFVWQIQEADLMREKALALQKEEERRMQSFEIVEAEEVDAGAATNKSIEEEIEEFRLMAERLKKKGVDKSVLHNVVEGRKQLSRLLITKDNRILLPDYNDAEVKLQPIHKAVFLLFLKHPEGLRFKELSDYQNELFSIYLSLSDRGTTNEAKKRVGNLCCPSSNSINEKCTRIREAFLGLVPDEGLASNYFITGSRGERKKVGLDRSLVTWEKE